MPQKPSQLPFEVRDSPIHGRGGFALHAIAAGTRIVEYMGERISSAEADARYEAAERAERPHVLLFTVDKHTVVDAGVGGNEARFINHSCEPNCEIVIERKRIFIEARQDIQPGEELTYDYALEREGGDDEETEQRFACDCGASTCRGTMLLEARGKNRRRGR